MIPCPLPSDQKSTPLTFLSAERTFSSSPSGMTSPWQNQADFWWTWSVVSLGSPFCIGQPRVTGTPPGALSGQKYGLATSGPLLYRATSSSPIVKSKVVSEILTLTLPGAGSAARARHGGQARQEGEESLHGVGLGGGRV